MLRIEETGGPSPFMVMGSATASPLVHGLGTHPVSRAVTADDIADEVLGGAWVVDLRDRAKAQPDRAYVGWLLPTDDGFALLADSPEELTEGELDLSA